LVEADYVVEGMLLKLTLRAIGAAIGALGLVPAALAVRAFWREFESLDAQPLTVRCDRARRALAGLAEVSWQSQGHTLRGWFVPGSERAAIVLLHGGGGTRCDVLPELEILSKRGFCVLAFDWPGHGESGGRAEWGEAERAALRSALDWLVARPEVDARRIGAFGFSSGGVPLIQQAATDSRVRAAAVAGTPGNVADFALWEYRRYGPITQWPALLAMRMRGIHWNDQAPQQVVRRLAPRPLLVVLGEADTIVPPAITRALFDAAGDPKELLSLPNVGHGEYACGALAVYSERLASFFSRALLDDPIAGTMR
jgi:pimeloyl-ACP methyl ester carboxylesterase